MCRQGLLPTQLHVIIVLVASLHRVAWLSTSHFPFFTNFRYVYPASTKDGKQVYESLLHFFQVDDEVGIVYSDNAPELEDATQKFKVRHNTSRPYVDETKSVVEREIRTTLAGCKPFTGWTPRQDVAFGCTTPCDGSQSLEGC